MAQHVTNTMSGSGPVIIHAPVILQAVGFNCRCGQLWCNNSDILSEVLQERRFDDECKGHAQQ